MRTDGRRLSCVVAMATALLGGPAAAAEKDEQHHGRTPSTPIEHVIVIVGENHTFDNIYGAYRPARGADIANLLSKRIIHADGTPGSRFDRAAQQEAGDFQVDKYQMAPTLTGAYAALPQPQTTYATGLPPGVPDDRYPTDLPNGPFQMTNSLAPYSSHFGDPVHRFFQMWQMTDKGKHDLFAWVGVTAGIGSQNFFPGAPVPGNTFQGGEALGFFNVNTGDAPVFKSLADTYAISDNYHQPIMGGTGANFLALVTGDAAFYNVAGTPMPPPANQIENPDALSGWNNYYTQDGYTGGSYVNCSDRTQPGVGVIRDFLDSQARPSFRDGNCAPGAYYLVNNYGLGYQADGTPRAFGAPLQFVLPPQTIPTIGDALSAKGVSWKYYTGGRNADGTTTGEYCGICDPLTGFTSIMTTPLKQNLQGMDAFYADVAKGGQLPAVAFIRPFESQAGHPANASMPDFESFITDVIARVKSNPSVWRHTAIMITVDEGGGYYDSGYIQPIDFFGDGTRIPLVVVSPWAKKGHIDHSYGDHVSILKFIERNWRLAPLSDRSRDNLPNPVASWKSPYVPVNSPAITDLMGMFDFRDDDRDR
jgi:acid phosphatase